ncbi:protein tramtrack, beta isoform-like isoform X2 [Daphnia carinata]|uniref:protein tramtrack, beta isoform-like isoform X2 n=1 Tax=Daphnia carinata TaxID=120202 RepID=UPI0028683F67|nr:protein tramtrack, beta isoform-like isoform X2 [Daphnia carinata]
MGPSSGVQEYCLRWNNHHSTLVSVMDALLQKGSLVDVTLAAEGKSIQVHRLVLCACSNYFQELLSLHWDKQAVVFLKDVKFDHLQALVDYMYRGEVNVSQDQLAAFLNTAEALKIKGLADGDRDRKNEKRILEKAMRSSSPSSSSISRPPKRVRKQSKEDTPPTEKTQLPQHQLPSLVRIPPTAATPVAAPNDRNESPVPSPTDSRPDDDMHSNSAADNLNIEIDDGEEYSIVEPKIETELEADYSGGSGDEEDWSDSEYPSRIDASRGEQGWNDDADGHMSGEGQAHLDHVDLNNSARVQVEDSKDEESEVDVEVESEREATKYRCVRCGRGYNRRDNRDRHTRLECGRPGRFRCPICPLSFTRKNNVTRHMARIHSRPSSESLSSSF